MYPDDEVCQVCGERLQVYKTETRSVITLAYGCFEAQEVMLFCPKRCGEHDGNRSVRIYRSGFLAPLVAPRHTYGFDVLAKVGVLRFLACRQRREIQAEIKESYGLRIPEGTVQDLISRFVDTMRAVHEDKVPVLRRALEAAGGFILHVDGTCEEGSQVHFACLTGPEPIVLWSEKIASENAIQIRRVLWEVERRFGKPTAVVEDLANPIRKAVQEQWPGVPIFYCHLHFLADVGKDLLGDAYARLRAHLQRMKIRPQLRGFLKKINKELGEKREEARWICQHLEDPDLLMGKGRSLKAAAIAGGIAEWILSAPAEGRGRPFPFELPHLSFYRRATRALGILDQDIVPQLTGCTPRGEKLLFLLRGILHTFLRSAVLARVDRELQEINAVFHRLRDALRLGAQDTGHGMKEESTYKSPEEVQQAEEALTRLRQEFRRDQEGDPSPARRKPVEIILRHLDKYWDGLFGHCLPLPDAHHRYIMVQRTNNMAERFFRGVKRFARRVTGKKRLNREVDAFPSHMLLVFNLKTPKYVEMVCGSLDRLPEAFAQLAQKGTFPKRSGKAPSAAILDRKRRRLPDFPATATAAFAGY